MNNKSSKTKIDLLPCDNTLTLFSPQPPAATIPAAGRLAKVPQLIYMQKGPSHPGPSVLKNFEWSYLKNRDTGNPSTMRGLLEVARKVQVCKCDIY